MAAPADLHVEARFHQPQIGIQRAAQTCQPRVVGRLEREFARCSAARDSRGARARRSSSRPRSECGRASVTRDIDEALQQRCGPGEIDPAIVFGAPGELARVLLRVRAPPARAARCRPCVRLIASACASSCACRRCQPLLLDLQRHLIRQRRRRRAWPAAVEEAERLIEARPRRPASSVASKSRSLSPGKPTMMSVEIAISGRTARSCAQALLVLQRRVAALHQRQDAVRAALHRQVQVIGELRHAGIGLDQAVAEFERVRGREANALDARHARRRGGSASPDRRSRRRPWRRHRR